MRQAIRKSIKEKNNIDDTPIIYTLLLDMNSIMKMALVNKKLNKNGQEIGMIYTTLSVIRNLLSQKEFNFCYAMYDGDMSGQLRAYIYPEYKANRDKHYETIPQSEYDAKMNAYVRKVLNYAKAKKNGTAFKRDENDDEIFQRQREIVFKCLEELFVRQVICDRVEGDDLIAYYVKNKKPNEKIIIASGDRDLTQLINDDVSIYVTQMKKIITPQNHLKEMGYTHENVMVKKVFCGDSSDNIKGIQGMGEKTFFKLFPKALTEKTSIEAILERSKELVEECTKNKKKPLKTLENVLNKVTKGSQGEHIYEINKKIIDLTEPLLTEEAKDELDALSYAPIDPTDRNYANLYGVVTDNDIQDLIDTEKFTEFFVPFGRLIENEKKYKG